MSKTKYRSLGIGFLLAALLLTIATLAWPFVPSSIKTQLDQFADKLPLVSTTSNSELQSSYDSVVAENSSLKAAASSSQTTTSTSTSSSSSSTATGETVSITISDGDVTGDVAQKLVDAKVITDAASFAKFLEDNGYASSIWTGTFQVKTGMTNEEIAKIITGQN